MKLVLHGQEQSRGLILTRRGSLHNWKSLRGWLADDTGICPSMEVGVGEGIRGERLAERNSWGAAVTANTADSHFRRVLLLCARVHAREWV